MSRASTEQENLRKEFTKALMNKKFSESQLKTMLANFLSHANSFEMQEALKAVGIEDWELDT